MSEEHVIAGLKMVFVAGLEKTGKYSTRVITHWKPITLP